MILVAEEILFPAGNDFSPALPGQQTMDLRDLAWASSRQDWVLVGLLARATGSFLRRTGFATPWRRAEFVCFSAFYRGYVRGRTGYAAY